MKQLNIFFLIGMLGTLFTSMFHVVIGAVISEEIAAAELWLLYPLFVSFLILGTGVMMKRKIPQKV